MESSDNKDTVARSSQQLANEGTKTSQAEQEVNSLTESDDKLKAKFVRKPCSQCLRVPKKITASSSGPVSSDVEDDL